jgi:YesN/AraC family two-component response regulator
MLYWSEFDHLHFKEDLTEEMKEMMRKERPSTAQRKNAMLAKITAYVDNHVQERITLKIIAAHCGVSVSTVTQLFQKQADVTFHDFVTNRRMVMADKLIREGLPLEQVGKMVGYQDHSTFYRAFRQYFGVSPRDYRCRLTETSE